MASRRRLKIAHQAWTEHGGHAKVLRAVASLELAKGILALCGAISLLTLMHRDPWDLVDDFLTFFHINPDHRLAQLLFDWADQVTETKLIWIAVLATVYAILRFVESYGLWKARVWAEWLALVSGGMYLPIEVYEITRKPNWFRVGILLVNLGVVLYMGYLRVSDRHHRRSGMAEAG